MFQARAAATTPAPSASGSRWTTCSKAAPVAGGRLRINAQLGDETVFAHATDDPEAHADYLRGRYYCNQRTAESLVRAIDCHERALARAPGIPTRSSRWGASNPFSIGSGRPARAISA